MSILFLLLMIWFGMRLAAALMEVFIKGISCGLIVFACLIIFVLSLIAR